MPDIDSVSTWLKTTIPGLLILAAAGSILALPFIFLVRRFSEKVLSRIWTELYFFVGELNLRFFIRQRMVRREIDKSGNPAHQVIYFFSLRNGARFSFRVFFFFVASTVAYFYFKGIQLTYMSAFLTILSFLTFYGWLIDFALYMVVYYSYVIKPLQQAREALKNPAVFLAEVQLMTKALNLKDAKVPKTEKPSNQEALPDRKEPPSSP